MLGLLRTSILASRASAAARVPQTTLMVRQRSLPFIPTDWMFRFFPAFCRDRARFFYRFQVISFLMGFGLLLGYFHQPFVDDNYDHYWESPLYLYTKSQLHKTGQLEENLRIKVRHFYPQQE